MRRHIIVLAALTLTLTGCGSAALVAQPPSTSAARTTVAPPTTSTPPTTSSSANPIPLAPPTSNVQDCFDGDCTLLLTGPTTIPLDATKLYYPAMRVTAVSTTSLTYTVTYPRSGGSESTIGVGTGTGGFGFQGFPTVEVGLTLVAGQPALVLQLGAPS
jgi:hypothetical protein